MLCPFLRHTRCRVGGHVEDALRVVQDALFHVGNGVAEVLRFVVVLEFFILQCVIQELMRLALLAFLQVVERSMLFAVARELIRTGICGHGPGGRRQSC